MASEPHSSGSSEGEGTGRAAISPAKRKRLQQSFEHANRQMAHEKYDFDYVTDLFTQCVAGDPANFLYVQSFLGNLKRKYNNNKKGSNLAGIKGLAARGLVKKAMLQKDWDGAIKAGLEALKLNPWDVSTLTQMAAACEEAGYEDCQMAYLKTALEANPKDPEVCKICANALERRKEFSQAIALWHRVEELRPNDEEAPKAIARLAVVKTIRQGGWDEKDPSRSRLAKEGQAQVEAATVDSSAISRLEKTIAKKPKELANYLELAELYLRDEQYAKAEEVLAQAYEVSDGDPNVRERWEDAQLRHLRQQVSAAERELQEKATESAKAKYKQLKKELHKKDLEFCKNRCERYPNNLAFKYDLGLRYEVNGLYDQAIKEFQQAKSHPPRKGLCLLNLGRCFEKIQEPKLAMSHYESAVEEIPDRDEANKKMALYLAGRLAMQIKHLNTAERHLNRLAQMEYGYKDVAALLHKVAEMRQHGENLEGKEEPAK